jgi:hypothetical protein
MSYAINYYYLIISVNEYDDDELMLVSRLHFVSFDVAGLWYVHYHSKRRSAADNLNLPMV